MPPRPAAAHTAAHPAAHPTAHSAAHTAAHTAAHATAHTAHAAAELTGSARDDQAGRKDDAELRVGLFVSESVIRPSPLPLATAEILPVRMPSRTSIEAGSDSCRMTVRGT